MAWNKNWGEEVEGKELAYDLRQSYAKLVGEIMIRARDFLVERNYEDWFEELDCLYIHISMKLRKEDKVEYNGMLITLNYLIREHPRAYHDKSGKNVNMGSNNIYSQLKKIHMWLFLKMEESDIFGSKAEEEDW